MQNALVKLSKMTDEGLQTRLASCLGNIAVSVVEAAECVGELDRRGFDFDGKIAAGTLRFLRLVSDGKLLGCVMKKHFGLPSPTITAMSNLSHREQREIADKGTVSVVVRADGKDDVRNINIETLSPAQRKQAFGKSGLRSIAEQKAWLDDHQTVARKVEPMDIVTVARRNGRKGLLIKGGECFLSKEDLAAWFSRI